MELSWAVGNCLLLAVAFVGSLYVWNVFPSLRYTSRNSPYAIKCRITSVVVVCILSPLYVYFITGFGYSAAAVPTTRTWADATAALVLTMIWFAGPLLQQHYEILEAHTTKMTFQHLRAKRAGSACAAPAPPGLLSVVPAYGNYLKELVAAFQDITTWRNVIVAPWGEEWIFRALMIPLLVLGGAPPWVAGATAPLFFGVAHLHHVYQYIVHEGVAPGKAVLSVGFQFAYTTLFGWYSAFLFVQTNSVVPPAVAHAFCNAMGFPDFGGVPASPHKLQLAVVYVGGLVSFLVLLAYPGVFFGLVPS